MISRAEKRKNDANLLLPWRNKSKDIMVLLTSCVLR
jgi:hypothetical protein